VGWIVWLLIPVVVTVVVAGLSWFRSRPVRRLDTRGAMRAHADYLDALVETARSKDRGPFSPDS
jgi:hypothetical protein